MPTLEKDASETALLESGLERLLCLLGDRWSVELLNDDQPRPPKSPNPSPPGDLVYTVKDPFQSSSTAVLIEVKHHFTPAEISHQLMPRVQLLRRFVGDAAVLVIAAQLSSRTRQLLDELHYGYLDLTGNVSFRLARPAVVLHLDGSKHQPSRDARPERGLRGDKAAFLIRALIDVPPPHRATDLARATGLSLAYVSRLLDRMESEALIKRKGRTIVDVDWLGLIRTRSASYELLRSNPATPMIAPRGIRKTLETLADKVDTIETFGRVAVTGSVAAAEVAPLAIGGQLMLHVANFDEAVDPTRRQLGLLPAAPGSTGDVLLLRSSPLALLARRWINGVPHVAMSQLALDCLGGSGRLPSEGEGVLDVMGQHVEQWQVPSLEIWVSPDSR